MIRSWLISLGGVSVLLAALVQAIETRLPPIARLAASAAFAGLWLTGGIYLRFIQPRKVSGLPAGYYSGTRLTGWIFIGFAAIWIGLSLFQFLHNTV